MSCNLIKNDSSWGVYWNEFWEIFSAAASENTGLYFNEIVFIWSNTAQQSTYWSFLRHTDNKFINNMKDLVKLFVTISSDYHTSMNENSITTNFLRVVSTLPSLVAISYGKVEYKSSQIGTRSSKNTWLKVIRLCDGSSSK